MQLLRQLFVFSAYCLALLGLHWVRGGLDADGVVLLGVAAQLGGPLAAAAGCFIAASRASGRDRTAWINFGIGSVLYLAGNLCYFAAGLLGIALVFPAAPEALYFAMALFVAAGIFQDGRVRERVSRLQIYNFILIYCAITLATLFVLQRSIAASLLDPFATVVAFAYPALWFSVAAFGVLSLILYDHGRKSFPMALLLGAVLAEACADFQYALELMNGTYQPGGLTQILWIGSTGLIVWAAIEQVVRSRGTAAAAAVARRQRDRRIAQATIPAVAVALILLSGTLSGALTGGSFVGFALALAVAFAVVAGLREHWIIHVQRQLRGSIEDSRTQLAQSQSRLTAVLQSTSDSVLVLDRDWRIEFFNEEARQTLQAAGTLSIGASFWSLLPRDSRAGQLCLRAAESQEPVEFEELFRATDIWLQVHAYPTAQGLSIFFRDISEQRRDREAIGYLAHHNSLTGLANRVVFQDRLKWAVDEGRPFATLLLDLDHFKEVNDTLGHPIGDVLLSETASRLTSCINASNLIARLGGDEFAILVLEPQSRIELAGLAQRILDVTRAPHIIEGQSVRVGASVGIAVSDGEGDADKILRMADIALYAAKGEVRGGCRFFEPAMISGVQQRQALRADLAAALDNGEFELAYQPIVDLSENQVCCFEALLRWRHPRHGLVAPDVFIPIAEESGAIVAIGEWVLAAACAEAANWPAHVRVAVNLSTRQFSDGDLASKVAAALSDSGLESNRLELEITESVLLKDSRANLATLGQLRDMGIRIALDDFGTGYSSLGYLQRFPFTKIKIDRSFINGLAASDESQAIVRSVVGLGQSLGMRVTAEGVETQAQLDWVRAGCDEAQGYFLGRPGPAIDVPAVIERLSSASAESARAVAVRKAG